MKKKIVLIMLAAVLLLGCGIGAWLYFSGTDESVDSDWVWFGNFSSTTGSGALSDLGYYYVPRGANASALCYMDFGAGASTTLCYKIGCNHGEPECDARVTPRSMFFTNDTLYYTDLYTGVLYSRDATGLSLREICLPGKQLVEEKMSVSSSRFIPIGDYAYYMGTVYREEEDESGANVNLAELSYLGRIHLTTGKDEVLARFEDPEMKFNLIAARDGSCLLYSRQWLDLDPEEPDYREKYDSQPCSLLQFDAATGEFTTLFEKTVGDCLEIGMVAGGKVYYNGYANTGGKRGNTYTYDLNTGKHTLILENVTVQHLGGGYAFVKRYGSDEREFYNLRTGKVLPDEMVDFSDMTQIITLVSNHGVVLQSGVYRGDGKGDILLSYVPYEAMADGLHSTDRLDTYSYESNMSFNDGTDTTEPTNPTGPTVETGDGFTYGPIHFEYEALPLSEHESYNIQYLPETVENPDNLPVLKWVCMIDGSKEVWSEDAVHELNRMLADRNMPFRVQFVMLTCRTKSILIEKPFDVIETQVDWFNSPEVQEILSGADLLYGTMTPEERKTNLMPITDYVTGDGELSLANAVAHSLNWINGSVDGEFYGIPSSPNNVSTRAWHVDVSFMKQYGLTEADFAGEFWEMDELFAKIYAANGNEPFLYAQGDGSRGAISYSRGWSFIRSSPSSVNSVITNLYQVIGGIYGIDLQSGTPKVVNQFAQENVRKVQEAFIRYKDAGYMTEKSDYKKISFTMVYLNHKLTSNLDFTEKDENDRYGVFDPDPNAVHSVYIPTGGDITMGSSYGSCSVSGVAAASGHAEEALRLLNLIAEDEAFRLQLFYGKEGRDYNMTNPYSHITGEEYLILENADGESYHMEFLSPLSSFTEQYNYFEALDGKTKLQTYLDAVEEVTRMGCPVAFDWTGLDDEMEAIGTVLPQYYYTFTNNTTIEEYKASGTVLGKGTLHRMDEARYDQMLQDLKEAGSDNVEAELQRQLDEWLANNPNWETQMKPAT